MPSGGTGTSAIWWDWDIGHLYELEHVWVYLDDQGRVRRGEASAHGGYHDMAVDGRLPLTGQRLTLCSEPGKHAFDPSFDFEQRHLLPSEALVPWPALETWIPSRVAWWVDELERTIPPHERRVLRIAHRGASAHAPENTLLAIERAAELGADLVELDVRLTDDGVPVVLHDEDVSRTTDGQGRVSELSLGQLKRFRAGLGQEVPTLAEAIEACLRLHLGLYLELKTGQAAGPALATLKRLQATDRAWVGAFEPSWLAPLRQLAPELPKAILFGTPDADPVELARQAGATYVHPCWERHSDHPDRLLSPEWIARVRQAGLGIITWHEERPAVIAALRRLGVDAICSDAPELLLEGR